VRTKPLGAMKPHIVRTVDPSCQYVYVVNEGDNVVSQYTIWVAGVLTIAGAATLATGAGPNAITTTH
jgi:hypothetical protein